MKETFVTIVAHAENLELRKDPGQVPYHMHAIFGCDATLVTYFYTLQGGRSNGPASVAPTDKNIIAENYPSLAKEVPGLKLHFLDNIGRHRFYEKAISDYLKGNAKSIGVLNLFHFNTENIYYALLYKWLNPKGKLYLKLDIDINYYRSKMYFFNVNSRLAFLKIFLVQKAFYPFFFSKTDVISAESDAGLAYFENRFKVPEGKMMLLPNGVDGKRIDKITGPQRQFHGKENILITVGRIGTGQKNNEMLLTAIENIDLRDWKVFLIGPIEKAFNNIIEEFYKRNPVYREKVFFTGKITDTTKLYDYYDRAKIFCLTSRDEGFPLSACEAAYFGNYLILTAGIKCFPDLTGDGRFGASVKDNDPKALGGTIQKLISDEERLGKASDGMRDYAKQKLTWQAIIPDLHRKLFG